MITNPSEQTGLIDYWPLNNSFENNINTGVGNLEVKKGNEPRFESDAIFLNNCVLSTESNYTFAENFTIGLYYKPIQINQWALLIGNSDNLNSKRNGLWFWNNNRFRMEIMDYYNKYATISNSEIYNNKWNSIVGTFDGEKFNIYINGQLKSTTTGNTSISNVGTPLYIGGNSQSGESTTANYSPGYYKDIMIFDRALTLTEIQKLGY